MFDYPVLRIVFAVYFMLIFSAVITAIGWCNPAEYKRRPVLFGLSTVFTAFGIFALVKISSICTSSVAAGDDLMSSVTNLFSALYENLSLNDYTKYASDQIGALVLAGIAIVFLVIAFLLSFVFTFTFFFRIALRVDLKLKNSIRYIIMAFCVVLIIIFGVISSETLITLLFLIYALISMVFLVAGNVRLNNYERQNRAAARAQRAKERAGIESANKAESEE